MPTQTTKQAPDTLTVQFDYLKLPYMRDHHGEHIRRAQESGETHLEFVTKLADREVQRKRDQAMRRRVSAAKLPVIKTMDAWDWTWNAQHIRREQIMPLFDLEFAQAKEKSNLILVGGRGLGKTHIALALAHEACCQGIPTLFTTAADMLNRLYAATADKSLEKALLVYTRAPLLVLDEVGYIPFSKEAGDLFFQVIAKRYERGPTLLTCNRAFKDWNEVFTDTVAAAAIIDRLVHHAQILTLKGKSYRLKGKEAIEADLKTSQ